MPPIANWLCCKKKADLLKLVKKQKKRTSHDSAAPLQMAPFGGGDHFTLCALVSAVLAQLSGSGGDDAGAGSSSAVGGVKTSSA